MKTASEMRVAPLVVGDRLVVGLRDPWSLNGLGLSMIARAAKAAGPAGQQRRRPGRRP